LVTRVERLRSSTRWIFVIQLAPVSRSLAPSLRLKRCHVVVTGVVIHIAMAVLLLLGLCSSSHDNHFKVSVYCPSHEVAKIENITWLETMWKIITNQVKVNHIYLKTH
jgi:hypothetical protein